MHRASRWRAECRIGSPCLRSCWYMPLCVLFGLITTFLRHRGLAIYNADGNVVPWLPRSDTLFRICNAPQRLHGCLTPRCFRRSSPCVLHDSFAGTGSSTAPIMPLSIEDRQHQPHHMSTRSKMSKFTTSP